MADRAFYVEKMEDGRVKYEYNRHGSLTIYDNAAPSSKGPFKDSRADKEIPERYPRDKELEEAESLKDFVENKLCKRNAIEALWIDGKCYQWRCSGPVLVECRTIRDFFNFKDEFVTEYGFIKDNALKQTDRKIIDLRDDK